jgi:hypothetical protein
MDITINAGLSNVTVKARQNKETGQIERTITLAVTTELDSAVAEAIGGIAPRCKEDLDTGDLEKATIPIKRHMVTGKLKADGATEKLPIMQGTVATAKAGDEEDGEASMVEFKFEMPFSESIWMFLGKHIGSSAELEFKKAQTEMKFAKRGRAS